MKLKHYSLWALALAFAAVSCSDDLENGSGNNGTDNENGKKAYMTINISTVSDGVMTKADPTNVNTGGGAGWGEDGNGWLGELPGKNEGMVYDINVFLVETEQNTLTKDNHLTLLNTTDNNTPIDGSAYKSSSEALDASTGNETEPNHGSRNVTVTMKKDLDEQDTKFQVFTIVNAGVDLTNDITTLQVLRNYIQKGGDNSVIRANEDNVATADKFVMSTHKMYSAAGNSPSIVNLSSKNTAENPAKTSVYVERLAARIDLAYPPAKDGKEAGILDNNNEQSPVINQGTFKLTGYMIVNQWKGGTNMFKQVTPTVTAEDGIITDMDNYGSNPMQYLGDEVWGHSTGYNFVLSPLFDKKTTANINKTDGTWNNAITSGDDQAYYTNYFSTALNDISKVKKIPTNTLSYQENGSDLTFYPIAYVRENTMNTNQQVNGFSTGVIFQTKFTPNDNFQLTSYSDNNIQNVALEKNDKGEFQFLTAEHFTGTEVKKLVYKDVKSVAARAFNITEGDTKGLLKGFMDGWTSSSVTLAEAQTEINRMSQKNKLSEKFKKYLSEQLDNVTDKTVTVAAWENNTRLTFNAFCENQGTNNSELLNKQLAEYSSTDIANLAEQYGIYFFRDGQSYHKFWIRHDDNNNNNKMAVMEFAIVRNNVYQLNVTGVRGLGDPLPFTPGKDDPGTPDENNEVTINVTIYVKDWVKRKNADIIL